MTVHEAVKAAFSRKRRLFTEAAKEKAGPFRTRLRLFDAPRSDPSGA
jgi:hypothetical protein